MQWEQDKLARSEHELEDRRAAADEALVLEERRRSELIAIREQDVARRCEETRLQAWAGLTLTLIGCRHGPG